MPQQNHTNEYLIELSRQNANPALFFVATYGLSVDELAGKLTKSLAKTLGWEINTTAAWLLLNIRKLPLELNWWLMDAVADLIDEELERRRHRPKPRKPKAPIRPRK
jgi:hypothetical protein